MTRIFVRCRVFSLTAYLLCYSPGFTQQKEVTHQQLIWYAYYNTLDFSGKYFLTTEVQERRFFNPDAQHQLLTRTHLHYRIGQGWDGALGFTYLLQAPQDPNSESSLQVSELRPYLEFNAKQKLRKLTLTHRYKLEWRFFQNTENGELISGYWNNFRARYRFGVELPIYHNEEKAQGLKIKLSDEVYVNFGKEIQYNFFDQNRVNVALNFQLNKSLSFEAGYINWYQQRPSGDKFYNRNIVRLAVYHKITFKKDERVKTTIK